MMQSDRTLAFMKKAVLVSIFSFFCLLSVLTGYLLSIVMDVKHQVTKFQEQSAQVLTDIARLEKNLAQVISSDAIVNTLVQAVEPLPVVQGDTSNQPSAEEQEIAYLLQCIGQPEPQYEYEGKQRTASWVQMKLHMKAALMRTYIASAEDFIDKVAAKTHEGAAYCVIDKDGKKRELQDWLREKLQNKRSQNANQPS